MKPLITLFIINFAALYLNGQIPGEGLDLWLKPETVITSQNNKVTAWNDNSSHHHNAVTKTTDYPQLKTGILNGYPAVHFDGMNTGMETPAFKTFPGKRGVFFIVTRISGRSKTSGVGLGNFLSTYHGSGVVWQFGASTSRISYYDGVGAEGFPISDDPLIEWGILAVSRYNDTLMRLYLNGQVQSVFGVQNNQPDSNTLKIGFNGRLGGTIKDSIPEVLNGDIGEIIFYNRALSASEIATVHKYLASKFNIKLASPPLQETWWFYGIIAFMIITSALTISKFISQHKLKQKLKKMEREQEINKERQRISKEMHDDIGAGLTQIILLSEAAMRRGGNFTELGNIADTSRKLVSNMSEIIWSINPGQKTLADLFAYLREQLNKQLEYSGIDYSVNLPESGEAFILSNEQRRNILLVVKEIINNAIKYSKAGNIEINALLKKEAVEFEISDNGAGFAMEQKQTGNGLKNIETRIKELQGVLHVNTAPGQGCCYRFIVPLSANI